MSGDIGNRSSHPIDGELLRYADGELTPAGSRSVRAHLDSCWQCRAELTEIEQTIGRCVRYRNEDLAARMPEPPSPWMDIHGRMSELDQVLNGRPWYARAWEAASGTFVRQRAWVTAVAMLLIGALVVNQLRNAPTVRAAELLEKAVRARAGQSEQALPARRIEVRTGSRRAERTVGPRAANSVRATNAPGADVLAAVEPLFARARYDWSDPMSAASFARWRDGLARKQDEVTTVRDAAAPGRAWYRVRTTTDASYLETATLRMTVEDLRPVEASFEFESQERVEISDLGPAGARVAEARPAGPSPAVAIAPEPNPATVIAEEIARPATPGEELEVLAALHRLGADLGEPVEVTREGAQVVVQGLGLSPALGARIAAELGSMPRAVLRLTAPPAVGTSPGAVPDVIRRPAAAVSPWQREIETHLGGRAEYDQFVDDLLSSGDRLMARMHAIRRLAARFGPEESARLSQHEQAVLEGMVQEHSRAAALHAQALYVRSRPVLLAMGAKPVPATVASGANWQASANSMMGDARRAEALVAAMLGGGTAAGSSQTPLGDLPAQLLSATAALRTRAADLTRQTRQTLP